MARSSLLLHPLAVFTLLSATPTVWSFASSVFSLHHAAVTSSIIDFPPPCRINRSSNNAVVLHATSITSTSWKSCAKPRFDEFASYTVGPWITTTTSSSQSTEDHAAPIIQEVEEVMRSCGGAVQGIRELPLSLIFPTDEEDTSKDRTYHNRADGGFVYADDGSYTAGPEQWDWNASSDESSETVSNNAKLFMASLAFPEFPDRRRMWLTAKLPEASEVAKCIADERNAMHQINPRVLELSRPVSTLDNSDKNNGDSFNTIESNPSQPPNINWKVIQRVRMPNSNQAWSLPRAKWEKQIVESDEESEEDDDATKVNSEKMGPLMGWAFIESISENQENTIFGNVVDTDAINVHMLAVCPASEVARSVVRCYDTNGLLQSVAFLDGSLSDNTGEQIT